MRQTLIVLSFIALVGLFFTINHFIVIPRQQRLYNSRVCRVLAEVAEGCKKRLDDQADYLAKNSLSQPPADTQYIKGCSDTLQQSLKNTIRPAGGQTVNKFKKEYSFEKANVRIKISYSASATKDSSNSDSTLIPLRSIMNPSIEVLHKGLFNLVLLVQRTDRKNNASNTPKTVVEEAVLYRHGALAAGLIPSADSLLKDRHFGQFSGINDVHIGGSDYKAFTFPFQLDEQELVLVGFLKENAYQVRATRYSRAVVLSIVIILIFLILSLPLVKIYLSSRRERLNTNDVRLLMVTLTAAPFFFIIITGTLLVHRYVNEQTDENLATLHHRVEQNLHTEIDTALAQLKVYDKILASPKKAEEICDDYTERTPKANNVPNIKDILFYPTIYPNLDDVHWINRQGDQVAKWYNNDTLPVKYLNVEQRKYFQTLLHGRGYVSRSGDSFSIEPIISWSTAAYAVNIVTPSQSSFSNRGDTGSREQAIMIGLSARLYSVTDPVLPKGYQFCIINEEGQIQFHSQAARSLHENLFEESNSNMSLLDAVAKKERALLNTVSLFDRDVKMLVAPLRNMDALYLVTYYNKRDGYLFVYHAAAFTLLCGTLSLFLLVILLMLYSLTGPSKKLNGYHTYDSAWMQPVDAKNGLYKKIVMQLLSIVLLALVFAPLVGLLEGHAYWFVFQASLLLPLYAATGYYLLKNSYKWANDSLSLKKANRNVGIIYGTFLGLLIASINYLQYRDATCIRSASLFFILFLSLFVFFSAQRFKGWMQNANYWLMQKRAVGPTPWYLVLHKNVVDLLFHKHYASNYLRTIRFVIFFLAVLPALGIMSFALNEESKMHVKGSQFQTARQILERGRNLDSYFAATKLDLNKESLYIANRKTQQSYGVYHLTDTLKIENGPLYENHRLAKGKRMKNSSYYQAITQFLFLPKDHTDFYTNTDEYAWHTGANDAEINLGYRTENFSPAANLLTLSRTHKGHFILFDLFNSFTGLLFLLAIIAFFIFHFTLVGAVTKKIFLLDFFNYKGNSTIQTAVHNQPSAWTDRFYQNLLLSKYDRRFLGIKDRRFLFVTKKAKLNGKIILQKEDKIFEAPEGQEEVILQLQHLLSPAYDAMWNELKSNERFLLYDFALDGFTNYKNVDLLYGLYRKGLIVKHDQQLQLMNHSFRAYLLGKTDTDEIEQLQDELSAGSTWKNLRNVFLVLFFAILIFLFATQQDVSNRILAIVSGLATLVPLLLRIFDRGVGTADGKK